MKRMSGLAHSLNAEALNQDVKKLHIYIREAASSGTAAHEVELGIWNQILAIGRQAFGTFLTLQGTGDLGASIRLADGREIMKLEAPHSKPLRTIFGKFELKRAVYGSRETQKIELVPLDTRLQLPASEFSYVLQDWDQALAVENSYAQTDTVLHRILGFHQPVDSLERMSKDMSQEVEGYRESQPIPPAREEGKILVVSADGKGIPMRRASGEAPILGHRSKGQKKNKKRMATVGTVYTIDPLIRTPSQVVESLFRDPKQKKPQPDKERPHPEHKQVWASLTHEKDGQEVNSADVVFGWLSGQAEGRNPKGNKVLVTIMDGQPSLWEMRKKYLPGQSVVEILDLLHVTPRLWMAAHVFHAEGSGAATEFVKERLLRVLQGDVGYVIGGLRQMATKVGLKGPKKKTLERICNYLETNRARLRYDEYLKAGYPIASGVIEGTCRHLVKDRMERAGMRWSLAGAQAMLDLRSTVLNGDWDAFTQYRIQEQTQRLYPYIRLVKKVEWPMAA
ncbi:MAG: ISKra4 family transposase [Planctomycetota bacterium]